MVAPAHLGLAYSRLFTREYIVGYTDTQKLHLVSAEVCLIWVATSNSVYANNRNNKFFFISLKDAMDLCKKDPIAIYQIREGLEYYVRQLNKQLDKACKHFF